MRMLMRLLGGDFDFVNRLFDQLAQGIVARLGRRLWLLIE